MRTSLGLILPWSMMVTGSASGSTAPTVCQGSPIDLEGLNGVRGQMPALHVEYALWNRSSVERSINRSLQFAWQYPSDGGRILIGHSFATAVECFLRVVAVWPRLHLLGVEDVAAEVHLEHDCLSSSNISDDRAKRVLEELYDAARANVSATQEDLAAATEVKRWCAVAETACGGCHEGQQNRSVSQKSVFALVSHLERMRALCSLLAEGPGVRAVALGSCSDPTASSRRLSSTSIHCRRREPLSWPSLSSWDSRPGGYHEALDRHMELVRELQKQRIEVDQYAGLAASYHKEVKMKRVILVKQVTSSDLTGAREHPLVHFLLDGSASASGNTAVLGLDDAEAGDAQHYQGRGIGEECQEDFPVDWFLLSPARTDHHSSAELGRLLRNTSGGSWESHPEWLFAHAMGAPDTLVNVSVTRRQLLPPRYSQEEEKERQPRFLAIIIPFLVVPLVVTLPMARAPLGNTAKDILRMLLLVLTAAAVSGLLLLLCDLSAPYPFFLDSLELGCQWWSAFPLPSNSWWHLLVVIEWPLSLMLTIFRLIIAVLGAAFAVILLLAYPAYVWPLVAYVGERASCINGIDWEVHVAFAVTLFAIFPVLVIFVVVEEELGFVNFMVRFIKLYGTFLLQNLDVYSDLIFVNIAIACETSWGAWSFWLFIVGVVVCQWLLPTLIFIIVACAYLTGLEAEQMRYIAVAQFFQVPFSNFSEHAARAKLTTHLLRTFCEDLPQAYMQYRFTMTVKKNPFIIFSMTVSLLSTFGSLMIACFEAFKGPAGFTRLE